MIYIYVIFYFSCSSKELERVFDEDTKRTGVDSSLLMNSVDVIERYFCLYYYLKDQMKMILCRKNF